jgi:hypothetical protein
MILSYKLVRCSNCGLFQVTTSKKALKCQKCNKSKVLSSLKIFYTTENGQDAAKKLSMLKEEEAIKKEKFTIEFSSYDNTKNL